MSKWIQLGSDIVPSNERSNDELKVSLSADGLTLAVGSPWTDSNGLIDSGEVKIYRYINNSWELLGKAIGGEGIEDNFGKAIDISYDGNMVVIGAPYNDGNGRHSGHVRVYQYKDNEWVQMGGDIDGLDDNDWFGSSVEITGNPQLKIQEYNTEFYGYEFLPNLVVGAPNASGLEFAPKANLGIGSVRTYVWNSSSGEWKPISRDFDPLDPNNDEKKLYNINGQNQSEYFGTSVSASEKGHDFFAVGAPEPASYDDIGNKLSGYLNGTVRIYKPGNFTYVSGSTTKPIENNFYEITGESKGDKFGSSISLSRDSKYIAIGGPENDANGADAGHVRVYSLNVFNKNYGKERDWHVQQVGSDIDGRSPGDRFGSSVSLSKDGSIVAIGAPGNDDKANESGNIQVYEKINNEWIQLGQDINGTKEWDQYGYSVDLSDEGDILAISGKYGSSIKVFQRVEGLSIVGPSGSAGDSTSTKSINENTTAIHTFSANKTVTWSIHDGDDKDKFSINSSTGDLSFSSAPE